ncbi:MAG: hypothetical protein WCS87_03290, partial [Methylococcaceae bacterium]
PLKPGQEILVNAVIPARIPVSSVMEGNFPITLPPESGCMPNYSFTSPFGCAQGRRVIGFQHSCRNDGLFALANHFVAQCPVLVAR